MLMNVDLPDPLGPTSPTISPGKTEIETSRKASTRVSPSPKCLLIFLSSTSASLFETLSTLAAERFGRIDRQSKANAKAAGDEANHQNDCRQYNPIFGLENDAAREVVLDTGDQRDPKEEA